MTHQSKQEIQALIENGQRLVREAEAALAATDLFFEQHNIDPRESMEFLRRHAGEPAVQAVQEQVKLIMQRIEENVDQQRVHAVKPLAGRRPRTPRNMV